MHSENKKKTVFVGLSGGVDSSVSAALLKEQGYNVVGVFIRTWQPDFIECSFREDRLDAMRVAAHLGIPFLECDAEEEYKRAVADYMISEYKHGRTPNPDVMCNREIKFGVFRAFADKHGAEYLATGHYARILKTTDAFQLYRAIDPAKDQSYFLYRLKQDDLAHVLFPIGGMEKTDVRKLAKKFGLPTAQKKDSQGICMLGDLDIKTFLSHYIAHTPGDVLSESGEVIGVHDGAVFLTLGERHGFTITKKTPNDGAYYIVGKNAQANTITVAQKTEDTDSLTNKFLAEGYEIGVRQLSWVARAPHVGIECSAQVRYHGEQLECTLGMFRDRELKIVFKKPVLVAPGQSIVLYQGDSCIGGGIVH